MKGIKPKIFIAEPLEKDSEAETILKSAGCEVVCGRPEGEFPAYTQEELLSYVRDADAVLAVARERFSANILASAKNLRVVAKFVIGFDDVDINVATSQGILITNSPVRPIFSSVAEHTVGFILALAKKFQMGDKKVRSGEWVQYRKDLLMTYLGGGRTVGLVGLGRIGSRVAQLLQNWGVRLIAYDPFKSDEHFKQLGVKRVDFETLLRESDFVSLHVPLKEDTRKMMTLDRMRMMKKTAFLINTARGGVVDQVALATALGEGSIAGAALDATEPEPIKNDDPLLRMDNVLFTPHISGRTTEMIQEATRLACGNVLAALEGKLPEQIVNPQVIPLWKERFAGKPMEIVKSIKRE